ncbi:MAG: hypothetical protein HY072_03075 [Deltaproteobacteria bacterium]|nr:hypothetical protein [Deltaproteobacteria bacterium]
MYRNSLFDQDLSKKLQDPKFSKGFILNLMEGDDGLTLQEALRQTIERMGVKEFCKYSSMRKQNVNDFVKGRRKLKLETLDEFLKPFHLKTTLILEEAA